MNKFRYLLSLLLAIFSMQAQPSMNLPKTGSGIDKGVSACFAGILGNNLIVAGGCNFPNTAASEGGKKKYYKDIYITNANGDMSGWEHIGSMPEPMAYGVSLQTKESLFIIGGNNENHALSSFFRLYYNRNGILNLDTLPSLPCTLDNMAGALCNNSIYIVGGYSDGKPSTAVYTISLKSIKKGWRKVTDIPGNPRIQPVCTAVKGKLYIWGGFFPNGELSEVATDGWMYDTKHDKWKVLPSPTNSVGESITLSGGTSTALNNNIICTGGVNKAIFLDAISGKYQLTSKSEYMNHPIEWYKFNDLILIFDTKSNQWKQNTKRSSSFARAGATAIRYDKIILLIGGELKPGIRTSSIITIKGISQ